MNYIYVASDLAKAYKSGGRHEVLVDAKDGSSALLIKNVSESDAGKYICTEDTDERRTVFFQLIVLLGTEY